MTDTVRTVLPTDLVALASYDGRVYANEAMTRDRIGTDDSPHPIGTAIEQWFSFARGRHTSISVRGVSLRGLASVRKRGSRLAWELDCLISATEGDTSVLMSLLDRMTEAAGRSGALKLFLRLASGSETERAAARCGFTPYLREQVYRRTSKTDSPRANVAPEGLRRGSKVDLYPVFQLYNALVPPEVRRIEGMTFTEWAGAQESLGRATQYVFERDGVLRGWLRVAGDGDVGRFDLLGYDDALDDLIEAALAKVANRESVCALAPEYQPGLASRLVALGFEPGEEFTVLSRRTVRTVKANVKVAAVARTTFG
jgi:Fe2+ transport system protein FeoA